MGIFQKKKEVRKTVGSSLPELDLDDVPEFPSYKPAINDIKREVQKPEFEMPQRVSSIAHHLAAREEPTPSFESGQKGPLFIKIAQYKAALKILKELKERVSEAERTMSTLDELKAREDEELEKWKTELEDIKNKLLAIDKSLFEV